LLGAIILSDPLINAIRREVRRVSPRVKVETDEIKETLRQEVLKREVVFEERADEAKKKVRKAQAHAQKQKKIQES